MWMERYKKFILFLTVVIQ